MPLGLLVRLNFAFLGDGIVIVWGLGSSLLCFPRPCFEICCPVSMVGNDMANSIYPMNARLVSQTDTAAPASCCPSWVESLVQGPGKGALIFSALCCAFSWSAQIVPGLFFPDVVHHPLVLQQAQHGGRGFYWKAKKALWMQVRGNNSAKEPCWDGGPIL